MFLYPLPSIPIHFQPILIENLSTPVGIYPKSIKSSDCRLILSFHIFHLNAWILQATQGYLILGTWYREPFCHQMGPCQTLRAENWWTQLLVRFRVFFYFRKSRNHLNDVQNSRNVVFLKKKPPAGQNRDNEDWRTEFVFTRIPKSQIPNLRISKVPKS